MQKIIFYTVVLLIAFIGKVTAQERTFEEKAKQIANQIEMITKSEKKELKTEVEAIDKQLQEGKITKQQADEMKLKAAEKRAMNIETKVALEELKIQQLIQDKVDGKIYTANDSIAIRINSRFVLKFERDTIKRKIHRHKERRTTSQFVFAAGLNNVITEGENFENSDYRAWGSHFYEWGSTYNTRIFKNNNLLHAKYGFSVMYNNLRPTENRFFVKNGEQTDLQTGSVNFDESRLRNVYLVAPIHLEFDFTPKKTNKEGNTYFRTHESFRLGIGGYGGVRIKTKQIQKYDVDDTRIKNKQKGDYNVSNYIYGLSAYIGYKQTSLYLKYDLNPVFKNNAVDQNNVSLGIRFDFN